MSQTIERNYINGTLDPDTPIGFATIAEYAVLEVLGDATKEKFGSSYDLISESLGTINVKYSILHKFGSTKQWIFGKRPPAKIPDYYICLGMDRHQTEIIKVWKIPGNSTVVNNRRITINQSRLERFKMYSIDHTIYDKVFQEMDIREIPEFCNTTKPKVNKYRYEEKEFDLLYPCEEWTPKTGIVTSSEVCHMEESGQVALIKNSIYNLSKSYKQITRQQIKEVSGIEDPEDEIEILCKKGIIMCLGPDDIRWV